MAACHLAFVLACLLWLVGCQPAVATVKPAGLTGQQAATTSKPESISEQRAYEIGYAALAKKLGYQPPSRDRWQWWSVIRDKVEGRNVWVVGADFAPAGGGDHGNAVIDAVTGEVVSVQTGRHLR